MDDDIGFPFDDGEEPDDDEPEGPPEPCPRCGRTHVAIFYGQRYRTFELHGPTGGIRRNFFNQSLARVSMRTCMDCGYIELYREEMLKLDD
jgi:predicted nucleic-acid-binding Zn-ribbon protein